MSDLPIDPLPPDIAALLEREEGAYPEDQAMKAAVLSHTEMAVALMGGQGPPGSSGPGGGGGGGGPVASPGPLGLAGGAPSVGLRALVAACVSAFVAGGIVGGVVMRRLSAPPPVASASAVVSPSAAAASAPSPTQSALAEPALASSAPPDARTAPSASAGPLAPGPRGDLTLEREILDAAHAALAHGRPGDALAAAERHAAQWPRGYLGEEREVVMIQALAASGRRGEAEQRAIRYRRAHPKSLFLPAIDAAVPPR